MKEMFFYASSTLLFFFFFLAKRRELKRDRDRIVLGEMIGSLVASIAGGLILISSLLG